MSFFFLKIRKWFFAVKYFLSQALSDNWPFSPVQGFQLVNNANCLFNIYNSTCFTSIEEIELSTKGATEETTRATTKMPAKDSTTKGSTIKNATTRNATKSSDEIGGDDHKKSQSLTIGLSLGLSFLVLVVIGNYQLK